MNTIATASTNTILAIELGKYKSVACVHDQAAGEIGFTTFETTRAQLQKLLGKQQPTLVIIEACLLAGWVHDLCGELGVRCLVANTASEAWRFKHLKRTGGMSGIVGWPRTFKSDGHATGRPVSPARKPSHERGRLWMRPRHLLSPRVAGARTVAKCQSKIDLGNATMLEPA